MISKKAKKKFDCVDFKRKAQERIYGEIKDLSTDELIAYFRRRAETGSLGGWWKRVTTRQVPSGI